MGRGGEDGGRWASRDPSLGLFKTGTEISVRQDGRGL